MRIEQDVEHDENYHFLMNNFEINFIICQASQKAKEDLSLLIKLFIVELKLTQINFKLQLLDGPISNDHCDWLYGIFGHETSCTRYWTCWNGTATEQLCIGGLLYNENAHSCDWPEVRMRKRFTYWRRD